MWKKEIFRSGAEANASTEVGEPPQGRRASGLLLCQDRRQSDGHGGAPSAGALGIRECRGLTCWGSRTTGGARGVASGLKRRTAQGRLSRALKTIAQWCRLHRHDQVEVQHHALVQERRRHCAYYGLTGNGASLQAFREALKRIWRKWLARRRRRGFLSSANFARLLKRLALPAAVVVHSVYRRVREPAT